EGEVVWVAGPAEEGVLEEVRAQSRGRDVKAVESPPLPDLAALLSEARGYVGCDSGVTHLAAACGAPTVALFGPTDPAVWGPRGERVVTLRRNAGCESCKQGEKSGHTCLAEIAVEEVLEAVLGFGPPGGP
ncbi:MAG: glycosyltransferase family 9 protein, partial [Nitrospinota bacterium]